MSATNRNKPGHERVANDLYSTPSWCVRRLVEGFPELCDLSMSSRGVWLEPAVGKGHIIEAVNSVIPVRPFWDACEIDAATVEEGALQNVEPGNLFIGDFKDFEPSNKYQVIITNPPYSLAMDFVEKAMSMQPKYVIMLLRTNFLASEGRASFMQAHTPDLYVLPNRPTFVRGKSDNTEYAWFVWDRDKEPGTPGKVVMLATTPVAERKLG